LSYCLVLDGIMCRYWWHVFAGIKHTCRLNCHDILLEFADHIKLDLPSHLHPPSCLKKQET